jgi:hypothetical protein
MVLIPVVGLFLLAWAGANERSANNPLTAYEETAAWVCSRTTSRQSIAATEIGKVGWSCDRPIIDYLGLLSGRSESEIRRGDLTSWFTRGQPDFWMAHAVLGP